MSHDNALTPLAGRLRITGNEMAPLARATRARHLGYRGATIWLTGLPASGKSTLAVGLEHAIVAQGRPAYRLDGDELRSTVSRDLGFSREDRAESVRRAALLARTLADAGAVAIVALISPYARDRAEARRLHEADGLDFCEVYVATLLEECERRDPKGLYALARRAGMSAMTGLDDPYEPPSAPDVRVCEGSVSDVLRSTLARLRAFGMLPAGAVAGDVCDASQAPAHAAGEIR
jgi:adenylyl-sulfate kinase